MLALGVAAVVTGPLVGGIVPATSALALARQARGDLVAGRGYLTGARQLRLGLALAWVGIGLAVTALVVASVIGSDLAGRPGRPGLPRYLRLSPPRAALAWIVQRGWLPSTAGEAAARCRPDAGTGDWPPYGRPGATTPYSRAGAGYPAAPGDPPHRQPAPLRPSRGSVGLPPPVAVEAIAGTPFGVAVVSVAPTVSGPAAASLVAGVGSILVSFVVGCFGVLGARDGWGPMVAGAFAVLARWSASRRWCWVWSGCGRSGGPWAAA